MNRIFRITTIVIFIILLAGCMSRPKEVGVLLKTKKGWTKLSEYGLSSISYDDDSEYKVYRTEEVSQLSFPFDESDSRKIMINKVPLDPSSVFLANIAGRLRRGGELIISVRKQSLTTISKGQDLYEISIPKESLEIGRTYALVAKKQGSYKAYFI